MKVFYYFNFIIITNLDVINTEYIVARQVRQVKVFWAEVDVEGQRDWVECVLSGSDAPHVTRFLSWPNHLQSMTFDNIASRTKSRMTDSIEPPGYRIYVWWYTVISNSNMGVAGKRRVGLRIPASQHVIISWCLYKCFQVVAKYTITATRHRKLTSICCGWFSPVTSSSPPSEVKLWVLRMYRSSPLAFTVTWINFLTTKKTKFVIQALHRSMRVLW